MCDLTTDAFVCSTGAVQCFVSGKLKNPLNGAWGHWSREARYRQNWKLNTRAVILRALHGQTVCLSRHKRVTFIAQTWGLFDDDGLRAALKPVRDALVGLVIHADDPRSGHVFEYKQVVERQNRGVNIRVRGLSRDNQRT